MNEILPNFRMFAALERKGSVLGEKKQKEEKKGSAVGEKKHKEKKKKVTAPEELVIGGPVAVNNFFLIHIS